MFRAPASVRSAFLRPFFPPFLSNILPSRNLTVGIKLIRMEIVRGRRRYSTRQKRAPPDNSSDSRWKSNGSSPDRSARQSDPGYYCNCRRGSPAIGEGAPGEGDSRGNVETPERKCGRRWIYLRCRVPCLLSVSNDWLWTIDRGRDGSCGSQRIKPEGCSTRSAKKFSIHRQAAAPLRNFAIPKPELTVLTKRLEQRACNTCVGNSLHRVGAKRHLARIVHRPMNGAENWETAGASGSERK